MFHLYYTPLKSKKKEINRLFYPFIHISLDFSFIFQYNNNGDDGMGTDNVCKFVKTENLNKNINIINFVLEKKSEFKQSFIIPAYYGLHIVINGSGVLHTREGDFKITKGNIFFTFCSKPYFIQNDGDLQYIYITFVGLRASGLFSRLNISYSSPVYKDFDFILEHWISSFENSNENNIDLVCESLLFYTLSYLCTQSDEVLAKNKTNKILDIKRYIDSHYLEPELSLELVSELFNYSPKYVSSAFVKLTKSTFSNYLKTLRMEHAKILIKNGITNIQEMASSCGYDDAQLFSKTFKKSFGISPREFCKTFSKQ